MPRCKVSHFRHQVILLVKLKDMAGGPHAEEQLHDGRGPRHRGEACLQLRQRRHWHLQRPQLAEEVVAVGLAEGRP